jgi:hypothetical protein
MAAPKKTRREERLLAFIAAQTLPNALVWESTSESFTYCVDLMDMCLTEDGDRIVSRYVERLEDAFGEILVDHHESESNSNPFA